MGTGHDWREPAREPQLSKQSLLILAVSMGVTTVIYASIIWLIEQPSSSFVSDDLMTQTGRGDMQATPKAPRA